MASETDEEKVVSNLETESALEVAHLNQVQESRMQ
jgi:hypothetical protein